MLRQNALLRRHALGSFEQLALAVTRDPAMLLWLNGTSNSRWDVNENYARELQELFCLGAGRGYTERDVRADGARADRLPQRLVRGPRPARASATTASSTTAGVKRIYGRRGRYDWRDAVRLTVRNRRHPSFMVRKLWGYFIPTPPPRDTARALERMYVGSRPQGAPAGRRDPAPPAPLRPAAPDGEAAGRAGRGHAARRRPRGRHDRVGVDVRPGRPDAVRAAQRVRLGRRPLDRHRHLPRPLADGGRDLQPGAARRAGDARQGPVRSRRAGAPRGRLLGQHAAVGGRPARRSSATPPAPWRPPPSAGSATPIPSSPRTRCGCSWPSPPTT